MSLRGGGTEVGDVDALGVLEDDLEFGHAAVEGDFVAH